MKLLIREQDQEIRLSHLPSLLNSNWSIEAVNHFDTDLWLKKLQNVEAVITMNWSNPGVACKTLKLIQTHQRSLTSLYLRWVFYHGSFFLWHFLDVVC